MREERERISCIPIGVVENGWTGEGPKPETSRIHLREEFRDGLPGLEKLARVQVLWYMHQLGPEVRSRLQAHPMGDQEKPLRGVFALRSPMRPNPIGSSVVDVVEVDGLTVAVRRLDAFDGSPVIDIKHAPA